MNKLIALVPLVVAVSSLGWGIPSREAASAQALPSSLYLMADIQVVVAKAPEYEAAFKALIAALRDARFAEVFDTYATDDGRYYVVYGLPKGYSRSKTSRQPGAAHPSGSGPTSSSPSTGG